MISLASSLEILESRIAPATIVVNTLADSIDIPGSATVSLRDAITLANDQVHHAGPDTIVFKPGLSGVITLAHGELAITDTLAIKGSGANKVILNAGGNSRIFDIDDGNTAVDHPVSISGLALINGAVSGTSGKTGDGGAIFSAESLTLVGDTFSGNSATGSNGFFVPGGGAVFVHVDPVSQLFGSVVVKNCVLSGNTARSAGAIYASGGKTVQITGSLISGNTATGNAGGGGYIYATGAGAKLLLSGDKFTGNSSSTHGGGMNVRMVAGDDTLAISSCLFADNTASASDADGGGIFINGGNTSVASSTIRGNSTAGGGGAGLALVDSQIFTMKATQVSGNAAKLNGGGLKLSSDALSLGHIDTITGSQFSHNSGDNGGGIYATGGLTLTVSGSRLEGNHGVNGGGGIEVNGTGTDLVNLKITGGDISGNSTPSGTAAYGGGVYMAGDGALTITGTVIANNTTGFLGGGIYANNSGSVALTKVIAHGNTAESGGALFLDGTGADATFSIKGGVFTDNFTTFYGGAFTLGGNSIGSTGVITGAKISGNISGKGGGIYSVDANATLAAHNSVSGNIAALDPDTFGF